jgi:large repetitive protein
MLACAAAIFGTLCAIGHAHAQAVTYTYDQLGRVVTVTNADGKQVVYRYDAAGNRTQHIVSATTVNRPPIAVDDAKTTTEGAPHTFDPRTNDSDPDSNPITVTNVSNGEFGTATVGGGGTSVTYTPGATRAASDAITYSISDGTNSASATAVITIANGPPIAVADAISVNRAANPGITFDPRVNDTDPGQDPVTVTNKTNGTKGTVTIGPGGTSLTYKPTAPLYGADSFTYTLTDDGGLSTIGTVNVTINFVNTAPVANDDFFQKYVTTAAFTVGLTPRTNDTDPESDPITITGKTNGTWGTVTIVSGQTLSYQRTSNYPPINGFVTDSFTYTISDGQGGTDTGLINIHVDRSSPD